MVQNRTGEAKGRLRASFAGNRVNRVCQNWTAFHLYLVAGPRQLKCQYWCPKSFRKIFVGSISGLASRGRNVGVNSASELFQGIGTALAQTATPAVWSLWNHNSSDWYFIPLLQWLVLFTVEPSYSFEASRWWIHSNGTCSRKWCWKAKTKTKSLISAAIE